MNSKQRQEQLKFLIKEAKINKLADEIVNNNSDIKDENYSHKIFEELLSNLEIEGIDY